MDVSATKHITSKGSIALRAGRAIARRCFGRWASQRCTVLKRCLWALHNISVFFLLVGTSVTSAESLSQNQRDTILKGVFHHCVEGLPREISSKYDELAVKLFCSCYSDHVANHMTRAQFEAMIIDPKTGKSRPPPDYQAIVTNANQACASELNTK